MCRGAVLGEAELEMVRRIEGVIRRGRVRSIGHDRIMLDGGQVSTRARTLHIHCAARGLPRPPLRPIFEPGRLTVQPFMWGFACFQFAMLGAAEALLDGDDEKNRLFPRIQYWDANEDYVAAFLAAMANSRRRAAYPALARWAKRSRLNRFAQDEQHVADPTMIEARERIARHGPAVAERLAGLLRVV